jgi:hypothetical protein
MTPASHTANRFPVMIAKLRKGGFQQNQVSQLLMKCDVAAGHS